MDKSVNKVRAVRLRKKGLSYSEVQKTVAVSKSTLSLWLRDTHITVEQKERIRKKMVAGQPFGAKAQRDIRIKRTKEILKAARGEIGKVDNQHLLYMGTMLYWAEGTKQKEHNPSQRVTFNNSDPQMIKMHLKWLAECLEVKKDDVDFEIYSHENIRDREKDVVKYWSKVTGFPDESFTKVYYKKDKKNKYRKNQGKRYCGLLRIQVLRSTDLNRKIQGWIEGICERCGVV